jgi:hypothetical protein
MGIPPPYLNILKLGTITMAQRVARWIFSGIQDGGFAASVGFGRQPAK